MTTVSTRADALLQKRCGFLESKLAWPSIVPATPPPGMKYLHFRANGLTNLSTRNYDLGRSDADLNNDQYSLAQRASHHSDLWAGALEASTELADLSWEDLNTYGLNPLAHPAHLPVGVAVRQPWTTLISGMYSQWPGLPGAATDSIRQMYKPVELAPDDPTASWSFQKLSLMGKASDHSLIGDLGQRHVEGTEAYAWSAREAGFPDANFTVDETGTSPSYQSYIPDYAYSIGATSSLTEQRWQYTQHHNPTILLMTVAVPEDIEAWLADAANAGTTASLTAYCRWVSCPHWMGFGARVENTYWGRSTSQALPYNPANVGQIAYHNACHYIYGDVAGDRDLLIYTPADVNNDYARVPAI